MEFVKIGEDKCPKCGRMVDVYGSKDVVEFMGRKIYYYADHDCKEYSREKDPAIAEIIRQMEYEKRLKQSNIPEGNKNTFTFPLSKEESIKKQQTAAMDKVRWVLEHISDVNGLLLWGGVGTGKSETSKIIGRHLIKLGFNVIYNHTNQYIEHFKYGIKSLNIKKENAYSYYLKSYDCIIVDEFGEEASYYDMVFITNLINLCYENKKKLIVTSNVDFGNVNNNNSETDKEKLTYKIWDRFHDKSVKWFHFPFLWGSLRRINE